MRALLAAAEAGDPEAQRIRASLYGGVASAVRILVLTVDVERVVIGGGIANLGAELLDGVRSVFTSWGENDSPFIASLDLSSRVSLVPDDVPIAAIGAALVGAAE